MNPDRINRKEARRLAEDEFARFAELTASLTEEEWAMPTDCTRLGCPQDGPSCARLGRRPRPRCTSSRTKCGGECRSIKQIESHHWVDGMNELQIRERQHLSNAELVVQLKEVGPKAVKGRWGAPPPMRYVPVPFGPPVGWEPLKYLLDVGFTRDVWCHRIDICCATGRPMHLTAEHDGRLVADIVAEWASTPP